jgi:SPBc2 prophage-derived uncharacterized protein yonG
MATKTNLKKKVVMHKCSCCGTEYITQKGNFLIGDSLLYKQEDSYIPICVVCINKYFNDILKKNNNSYHVAFKTICALTNMYYNNNIVNTLLESDKMSNTFTNYVKLSNLSQYKGKTFNDTVVEDNQLFLDYIELQNKFENSQFKEFTKDEDDKAKLLKSIDQLYDEFSKGKNLELFWGFDYTKEEHVLLETNFQEYLSEYDIKNKVEEELFKSLCQTKLEADKARLVDIGKYEKLTGLWQKTLESANIKPSQQKSDEMSDKQVLGVLIKKWENTRPISEPQKRWADVDGLWKMVVLFIGSLSKMVGLDNKYSEEYEQEIGKYTVQQSEYNSANTTQEKENIEEMFGEF